MDTYGVNKCQRKPKGQSRMDNADTGNIGYTRHMTKTNKLKNTTQKTKKMSIMDPTKNWG